MSNSLRHVQTLSQTIGPRGSTSVKEVEASTYVENELSGMGLHPERDVFQSVSTFSWTFMIIYSLFPLAALFFHFRPMIGLIVSGLGLLLLYLESNSFHVLSHFLARRPSQNIRAIIEPRSKAVRQVIISAHVDSSRSALNFSPALVGNFRQSYIIMFLAMASICWLYLIGYLIPQMARVIWFFSLLPAAFLFIPIGTLIHREIKGEHTPGANDDASGVAVLLETARILAKNPPVSTRVEILATGCEEAGLFGMVHHLKLHRPDKKSLFINLDNLGAGTVTITTREGIIGSKPASNSLLESARAAAEAKKLTVKFLPYTLLTTDATAALFRGYGATSVMGIDDHGRLPNWHWCTDTFENVVPENLEVARELVLGMLRELEQ